MNGAVIEAEPAVHQRLESLHIHILDRLEEDAVIGLDALIQLLSEHSWNQVFHAVDRLARDGSIVLRRHGHDYMLFSTAYPT